MLGDYIEAAAILAIVVLNAVLGVIQESRAEEALAALRRWRRPRRRSSATGTARSCRPRELVPGDLVLLEAGNYVPADLRLIESVNLRIEEAALTGESVPVEKDAGVVLRQDVPPGRPPQHRFHGHGGGLRPRARAWSSAPACGPRSA